MLIKTHSLPFPFLFFCPNADLSRAAAEGPVSPVIPGGRRHPVILTERSEWKDLLLFGSLLHQKRNGKPLMLIKTHSLPFPFLFFYTNADLSRRLFCHLERQSRGLLEKADSSAPVLRTYARNNIAPLTITRKTSNSEKTAGKRNSFPGFSFFECL